MLYVVTGGAGFIGSHLVEALSLAGHELVVIDDLSSGRIENIASVSANPRVRFVQGTVLDLGLLLEEFQGADGVFHQAAFVSVPGSIRHPLQSHEVTLTGTLNVLLAARDTGVKKVVHASSAAVYGNLPGIPKREDMPVEPLSPYAVAKYAGEQYCRVLGLLYDLPTVSLRYFNVYGARQDPASDYAAVIPRFIANLRNGKPPVIFGDGTQTRDFVYVRDVVRANILAMERDAEGVYNIGSGKETSINELATILMRLLRFRGQPVYAGGRPGDVMHSVADISRARSLLGWEPAFSLEEGLSDTLVSME
ncbi:MAG TPA: SDR family oxidoreductase [Methanolinea sp.]|jgi:UDP-glucose 4-epimerase|nr:SDR family oxidoreductase [Methanolinea sp.]HOS81498.1 SDR family oxidoreductase [Methanolinea sp.]HPC55124.1 SDR family oxidoreductase [Methanolinea sp.]HQE85633.1 SDR family oxidoreductase [Methanolinea sp.]HQI13994.1 SDR family oxidoreductase [Methanolinea sp.]